MGDGMAIASEDVEIGQLRELGEEIDVLSTKGSEEFFLDGVSQIIDHAESAFGVKGVEECGARNRLIELLIESLEQVSA